MRISLKWMKAGLAMAIAGCAISVQAADAAAQDPAKLAELVEKQNKQIEMLMQRLDSLEKKQAEDTAQVKKVVMETNAAVADTNKKVEATDSKFALGKGIDGLKITGDLRVRAETRSVSVGNGASPSGDRSRFRERLRLGGVWTNKSEEWEIGVGLATGNDAGGRSTNTDWGSRSGSTDNGAYDHMDIWLDYAYATHKWNFDGTPVSMTIGQQKCPFVNTMLNWDGDLRPQGLTLQYGDPLGKDYSGAFVTGGAYVLDYQSDGKTKYDGDVADEFVENVFNLKLQGGYAHKGEDSSWLAAAGFETITSDYRNSTGKMWGNSNNPNNPVPAGTSGVDTGYDYNILDFYGEYKTTVKGIELKPYGHVAYNVGAEGIKSQQSANYKTDAEESDSRLGWMLGVDAKKGKWKAGYAYAYIGADCVFGPMRDSDFGETAGMQDTNLQGHIFKLGYDITKNVNLGGSLMFMDAIENYSKNSKASNASMLQLDLVYKF